MVRNQLAPNAAAERERRVETRVVLSRRTFLTGLGAGAASVAINACSSKGSSTSSSSSSASSAALSTTTTTVLRAAGDLPDPTKPEGTDLLPQIEHIIVVMMENHSYDN